MSYPSTAVGSYQVWDVDWRCFRYTQVSQPHPSVLSLTLNESDAHGLWDPVGRPTIGVGVMVNDYDSTLGAPSPRKKVGKAWVQGP